LTNLKRKNQIKNNLRNLLYWILRIGPTIITRKLHSNNTKNASSRMLSLLLLLGGDGGALNSPSRGSYPDHTTSLIGNSDYAGEVTVAFYERIMQASLFS